jgi:hypothetical protein
LDDFRDDAEEESASIVSLNQQGKGGAIHVEFYIESASEIMVYARDTNIEYTLH